MLALAVMSTAFTGQAIALGFDRRYGVIRRLAATALPRWLLVAGRLVAVLGVVAIQVVVLVGVGRGAGLAPGAGRAGLGAAAGAAGLRCVRRARGPARRHRCGAEIMLAVANLVWFVLLLAGGIVIPVGQLPGPLAAIASALPSGALAEGLRTALSAGQAPTGMQVLVLLGWTVLGSAVAVRTVRFR